MCQLRFGLERHLLRNTQRGPTVRVGELIFGHINRGADQRVSARGGIRAVHRVHAVSDPARAAHVLPLDSSRGLALLLLPRLVQRRYDQILPAQVLGDIPPHHALNLVVVPNRVVEQPLRRVRSQVAGMLGDGPPVLARQIADQRRHVLPCLDKWLHPGKARPQPPMQQGQVRHSQLTLYHGSRSRFTNIVRHNMMIMRRLLP